MTFSLRDKAPKKQADSLINERTHIHTHTDLNVPFSVLTFFRLAIGRELREHNTKEGRNRERPEEKRMNVRYLWTWVFSSNPFSCCSSSCPMNWVLTSQDRLSFYGNLPYDQSKAKKVPTLRHYCDRLRSCIYMHLSSAVCKKRALCTRLQVAVCYTSSLFQLISVYTYYIATLGKCLLPEIII